MTFAEFWTALPEGMRRGDKARARTRYDAIQKRGEGELLTAALNAYIAEQKNESWRHFQYCSTWLGRWEDHIPEKAQAPEPAKGVHFCRVCAPGHDWKHSGECDLYCLGERYFTCPEQREAMRRAIKSDVRAEKMESLFSNEEFTS